MGILTRMVKGNYTNEDAVENVVRYVTRTRAYEDRKKECLMCGGKGVAVYQPVDFVIRQIEYVQKVFGIERRRGRRMYHETFSISEEEFVRMGRNVHVLYSFADQCAQYYFDAGYQVVYAVHGTSESNLHIHFAVSSINFVNGAKWHDSKVDLLARNEVFNDLMRRYQFMFVMSDCFVADGFVV